jgi:hypothetical protein
LRSESADPYGQVFTFTVENVNVALVAARGAETTCTGRTIIAGQTQVGRRSSRIEVTSVPSTRVTDSMRISPQLSDSSPPAAKMSSTLSKSTAGSGGFGVAPSVTSSQTSTHRD